MAGIEKICEVSGVHAGGAMYGHKRNLIQVLPEHRAEFKNHTGYLMFCSEPELVNFSDDKPKPFFYIRILGKSFSIPRFWTRFYWQWRDVGMYYKRPSLEWNYCLYVPAFPGNVRGEYWNYTTDPETTLENLTDLVGELEVFSFPGDLKTWQEWDWSVAQWFELDEPTQ